MPASEHRPPPWTPIPILGQPDAAPPSGVNLYPLPEVLLYHPSPFQSLDSHGVSWIFIQAPHDTLMY